MSNANRTVLKDGVANEDFLTNLETWSWTSLLQELAADGDVTFVGYQEDAEIIQKERCPFCGKLLKYRAFQSHKKKSYRAFGLCVCGYWTEF